MITVQLDAAQQRIFYGFLTRNPQWMIYVYDDNGEVRERYGELAAKNEEMALTNEACSNSTATVETF